MDNALIDPAGIALLDLADRKLHWLDTRQTVLAQNVANADTPGWKSRDVRSFADVLASRTSDEAGSLRRTSPLHLAGTDAGPGSGVIVPGEQAPDGNAVSLDDQLVRIAQTDSDNELVSALTRKYLGMFRMAIEP